MYKGLVGVGVAIALRWAIAEYSYESVLALITMLIIAVEIMRREQKKIE